MQAAALILLWVKQGNGTWRSGRKVQESGSWDQSWVLVKCGPAAADRHFSVLHCSTEGLWGGMSRTMLQGQ